MRQHVNLAKVCHLNTRREASQRRRNGTTSTVRQISFFYSDGWDDSRASGAIRSDAGDAEASWQLWSSTLWFEFLFHASDGPGNMWIVVKCCNVHTADFYVPGRVSCVIQCPEMLQLIGLNWHLWIKRVEIFSGSFGTGSTAFNGPNCISSSDKSERKVKWVNNDQLALFWQTHLGMAATKDELSSTDVSCITFIPTGPPKTWALTLGSEIDRRPSSSSFPLLAYTCCKISCFLPKCRDAFRVSLRFRCWHLVWEGQSTLLSNVSVTCVGY